VNVIECHGLTKAYGNLKAVNDLSVNIQENKITGLIGRNGAGKTTLLKLIAGFLHKTSGEVFVFSERPFNSIKVSANIIFVDDHMMFPPSLNLDEIVDFAGSLYENFDREIAGGLLKYFDLKLAQPHSSLSKGMKSTFNSILGISARCALTIFDEPTTGMDAAIRKDFYRALLKDYMAYPRTMLISSHHLNEIEDLMEDVLLLHEGKERLHMPITDLAELAVGLRGKSHMMEELVKDQEIFHQESLGKDDVYLVVRNNLAGEKLQKARGAGVEISPVSSEDLCVYLTAKTKGGIDHVFDRN